mmetsp:Transcript_6012/g.13358  ORF Transcript_6012/g.13358 Transcript_6012/m.13358 type:complete len:263 (+) Transcript_6012:971-1759(+)
MCPAIPVGRSGLVVSPLSRRENVGWRLLCSTDNQRYRLNLVAHSLNGLAAAHKIRAVLKRATSLLHNQELLKLIGGYGVLSSDQLSSPERKLRCGRHCPLVQTSCLGLRQGRPRRIHVVDSHTDIHRITDDTSPVHVTLTKVTFRSRLLAYDAIAKFDCLGTTLGGGTEEFISVFNVGGDDEVGSIGIMICSHPPCSTRHHLSIHGSLMWVHLLTTFLLGLHFLRGLFLLRLLRLLAEILLLSVTKDSVKEFCRVDGYTSLL